MPASEYGSYYWCVILEGHESKESGEAIHLHADEVAIDSVGTLTFMSAGRRPAGADPAENDEKSEKGKDQVPAQNGEKSEKKSEDGKSGEKKSGMIYVAFAPGSWKLMYAAKLRDGTPASIEHWNSVDGNPGVAPQTANAGAVGFGARE
jgi:hypothetical protein